MWQDEKRRPGPLPQTRWLPLVLVLLVVVGLAVKQVHGVLLAIFVILIGLGSFYAAAQMNIHRLEDERYSRGPGWWLGVLLSKTSVGFARSFYVVLGIGICALGIWDLSKHI
jgi:uncharacterized membrane protein YhaH (DUF805 family)